MRRYIQILLPELSTLSSDSILDYSLVNGNQSHQGSLSWAQLLQQYNRYRWFLLLAATDTVCTTLNFPLVKKSQRDNLIKSRVQQMLLGPLNQHVLCYQIVAPQNAQATWTARAPLERLQQQLQHAGVLNAHIQALAASPNQNTAQGQVYTPVSALNFARQLAQHSPLHNKLYQLAVLSLLLSACLWLVLSIQTSTLQAQVAQTRQASVMAVQKQWPSIPTVIAPLAQARRALQEQGQDHTRPDAIHAIQIALEKLAPLNVEILDLHWEDQLLSLTLADHAETDKQALQEALQTNSLDYSMQLDTSAPQHVLQIKFTPHE